MLYQGDEDPAVYGVPGQSSVDFLARVYGLRKRLPAIREGFADYASATATGGVLACLRETPGQRALVLISFNPRPVASKVTTNRTCPAAWTDELSGERLSLDMETFPAPTILKRDYTTRTIPPSSQGISA